MREDVQSKAKRLAGEGRVTLRRLEQDHILATVRGDTASIYNVGWEPSGWWCTCSARGRCSHIRAVQLVVLEPLPGFDAGGAG